MLILKFVLRRSLASNRSARDNRCVLHLIDFANHRVKKLKLMHAYVNLPLFIRSHITFKLNLNIAHTLPKLARTRGGRCASANF